MHCTARLEDALFVIHSLAGTLPAHRSAGVGGTHGVVVQQPAHLAAGHCEGAAPLLSPDPGAVLSWLWSGLDIGPFPDARLTKVARG
jgi:hypothetical protein